MQIEMKIVPLKTATRKLLNQAGWITGSLALTNAGKTEHFKFQALAFDDHAECASYELGRSKLSKLWIQNALTKETVFNFDRGLDVAPATKEIQGLVDFLTANLVKAKK